MKKIVNIFVILLLVGSIITLKNEVRVRANPEEGEGFEIDTQLIFNITESNHKIQYNF